MSTDLESRRDLPRIQVRAVKTETLQSCSATDDKETIIQQENSETDDCQTPKSEEHKIPAVLSCPPAPRKPRRSFSCKRKLTELEFFEIVNREEVDSFFQSSFELLPKRRSVIPEKTWDLDHGFSEKAESFSHLNQWIENDVKDHASVSSKHISIPISV
ncbi:hypothetical protein POTOM_029172 [Populus tomentosa]|uniref:Cyclin-dependent protein kinase inhibitor SMR2 n=1 Tax=Populus tomentosa TaxID=118781 RepID=A0A8X8CTR5_POPTO|nr:hypothetical protein POTOM_029172 [Populus tomentosa]